jgi:hypothetical protein
VKKQVKPEPQPEPTLAERRARCERVLQMRLAGAIEDAEKARRELAEKIMTPDAGQADANLAYALRWGDELAQSAFLAEVAHEILTARDGETTTDLLARFSATRRRLLKAMLADEFGGRSSSSWSNATDAAKRQVISRFADGWTWGGEEVEEILAAEAALATEVRS